MGAYGSRPIMELESDFGSDKFLTFCSCAVQGWRMSQEDAHLNKLIFDNEIQASLFGVFDGHGGSEVAKFVSAKFIEVLKENENFKSSSIEPVKALESVFLDIDAKVADPNTKKELEEFMTEEEVTDSEGEEEIKTLQDEAEMPIDDIIEKYGGEDSIPEATKVLLEKRRKSIAQKEGDTKEKSNNEKTDDDKKDVQKKEDSDEKTAKKDGGTSTKEDEEDDDFNPEKAEEGEDEEQEGSSEDEDEEDSDDSEEDSSDEGVMSNLDQFLSDDSSPGFSSGTTACVCLMISDAESKKVRLFTANVGDSRAVLCRDNKALDLSVDHKPNENKEIERIKKAGGSVNSDGRVNGGLNLSRAIGDHNYKKREDLSLSEQMISSQPDLSDIELSASTDKFIVIACDGIWNSLTSQEVIDFINERLKDKSLLRKCRKDVSKIKEDSDDDDDSSEDEEAKKDESLNGNGNSKKEDEKEKPIPTDEEGILREICEDLFHHVLSEKADADSVGCDNMTCTIIMLKDLENYAKEAKVKLPSVTLPLPDQTVNTTDLGMKKRKLPEEKSGEETNAKKIKTNE